MDGIVEIIISTVLIILVSVVPTVIKNSAKRKREQGGQQPQPQPQSQQKPRRNVIMEEIFREMLGEGETWQKPATTFGGHPADYWDEIHGNAAQREQPPLPAPPPSMSPALSPQYAMKGYEDSKESEMMRAYEQRSAAKTTSQAAAMAKGKKKRHEQAPEAAFSISEEADIFAEGFDIREAVLYSEILAPKFREEDTI